MTRIRTFLIFLAVLLPAAAFGQHVASLVRFAPGASLWGENLATKSEAQPAGSGATRQHDRATETPLRRWLDLTSLSYGLRYRNTVNVDGRRLFEFGQDRYLAEGRVTFDRDGRFFVGFRASSGRYFNWSYADLIGGDYKESVVAARKFKTKKEVTDLAYAVANDPDGRTYKAGIPSRGGYFYPRQLFLSASPLRALTLEFGSFGVERGQNTEITSFDDDGYLAGERLRLRDPAHLFVDEIVLTSAYLGSPLKPNFFARGNDLGRANYSQYLVAKSLPHHLLASADYTLVNHTHTFREALSLAPGRNKIMDAARVELYQRPNDVTLAHRTFAGGSGFAISAHQTFQKRLGFEGGYAHVDEHYAILSGSIYLATVGFAWNGDSYETGKRGFTKINCKLSDGVSLFGFYTHSVTPISIGHNQQGFNGGLNIDVKDAINARKRIF